MDTLGPVISVLIRRCPEFRGSINYSAEGSQKCPEYRERFLHFKESTFRGSTVLIKRVLPLPNTAILSGI